MRHLGRALGELEEQAGVAGVAEQPDALAAGRREGGQVAQRRHILGLRVGGHTHPARRQDARHQTAPSGNSWSVFLTSARKRSASAPSTTRWSYDIEIIPIMRIAMVSVRSGGGNVITLGRFSIVPTPRIATCG